MTNTGLLMVLSISILLPNVDSFLIPLNYTARVRPSKNFQAPFTELYSHIYSYITLKANKNIDSYIISEKAYEKPHDSNPVYEIYLNSYTGYGYYVDHGNCTKTLIDKVYANCLYVGSYITAQYLLYFRQDLQYVENVNYDIDCPNHRFEKCNHWKDTIMNITIYASQETLKTMLLSGIIDKPMAYDNFKISGYDYEFSTPSVNCKEEQEFTPCDFAFQNGSFPRTILNNRNYQNLFD